MTTAYQMRTNWQAVILSAAIPVAIAAGFVDAAIRPFWQPTQEWLWGMAVFIPLEFVRALLLGILGDAYKTSAGPLQAAKLFVSSVAMLLGWGVVWLFVENGFRDTVGFLTDPSVLMILGLPVIVIVIDAVIGLVAFRGDPKVQAARLEAIYEDSLQWLGLFLTRLPFIIAPMLAILAWMESLGHGIMAWDPTPVVSLLRCAGLLYVAAYFLGKAALIAHVYTAQFARSGRRLLDASWIQRIIYLQWRNPVEEQKRHEAAAYKLRPPVKSVLAFEDKLIDSIKSKSEPD